MPEDEPKEGYLCDFGINAAGNVRLGIRGERGQRVILRFGELLAKDGGLDLRGMIFEPLEYLFRTVYILKGGDGEIFVPHFSCMGFRYCLVLGITPEQATPDLLRFEFLHSAFPKIGSFSSSDQVINRLQKAVETADLSNFHYFPTDCPHREKHGWTGDASLSGEEILLSQVLPEGAYGRCRLTDGWVFADTRTAVRDARSGEYRLIRE